MNLTAIAAGVALILLALLGVTGNAYLDERDKTAAMRVELDGARAVTTELHARTAAAERMRANEYAKVAKYVSQANDRISRIQLISKTGCAGADEAMEVFWEARRAR